MFSKISLFLYESNFPHFSYSPFNFHPLLPSTLPKILLFHSFIYLLQNKLAKINNLLFFNGQKSWDKVKNITRERWFEFDFFRFSSPPIKFIFNKIYTNLILKSSPSFFYSHWIEFTPNFVELWLFAELEKPLRLQIPLRILLFQFVFLQVFFFKYAQIQQAWHTSFLPL